MNLEEQLRQLVVETCQYSPGSTKRQQGLTQIIRLVIRSGKLWQENTPYYQDALQQTWLYLCRNLCEATTGKAYDTERANLMTWLNRYLKWRLQDLRDEEAEKRRRHIGHQPTSDPIACLPAPPDVPPILQLTQAWAEADPEGYLSRTHIEGHPQVTCQVLILRRLPPETSWKILAAEFGLSISTLSSFYQRQCLPCLRKFGETQRYL